MSKPMPYSKRISTLPGMVIDLTMIDRDGVFITIESDGKPEVIFLPSDDFVKFAGHVNDALQHIET